MPKPKSFLKESKGTGKKKAAQKTPETADEFLATGVEQEEAGEKWRAGDSAKSMRFFMRAISTYDDGLKKHPHAFDLAYNKARVQYEITQHPKLATQLPAPLIEILKITLQSHREALSLEQDNTDALFNTAQVLTSLAEAITDTKHPSDSHLSHAMKYLQEAIELFQRCLVLQELRFTEMQEQVKQMEAGDVGPQPEELELQDAQPTVAEEGELNASDDQEQWAAVVEPITKDTLVDTAVAQLETLTILCNLLTFNPGVGLGWVEEYSLDLLQEKIAAYMQGSARQYEASLARAKFTCALAEVLYRSERTEVETYYQEMEKAYADLDISTDPEGLCSKADALMSFNSAVIDLPPFNDPGAPAKALALRWQGLSAALDALTKASKLPDADNLPKIHLARGDVEMNRWRLGMPPWDYTMAQQYGMTLLRNAQTYYRGAAALARRDGATDEERDGTCKEAIAAAVEGQKEKLARLKSAAPKELMIVAEDMVDDGWISAGEMEVLLS